MPKGQTGAHSKALLLFLILMDPSTPALDSHSDAHDGTQSDRACATLCHTFPCYLLSSNKGSPKKANACYAHLLFLR